MIYRLLSRQSYPIGLLSACQEYNKIVMQAQDAMGELKKIDPVKIVGDSPDDFEDFFLVLAVIYNDLKGLVQLNRDFNICHPMPEDQTLSSEIGEYNGATTQLYKILAGLINEFLIFLEGHEKVYQNPQFKLILLRLDKSVREQWADILDAAFKRTVKKGNKKTFGYKLMLIRNNVAFHYHQSDKVMRQSYKEFFSDQGKFGTDFAYYMDGGDMQRTRFFYADAAVQRYLLKTASEEYQLEYRNDLAHYENMRLETFEMVKTMNMVLANLLRKFIELKRSK
jgi:hypothetical protein